MTYKTFGELSKEEKLDLISHAIDGGKVEYLTHNTDEWVERT